MLRQAFWFAVAGAIVAVLAGGAGDLAIWVESTTELFDGGTRITTTFVGLPWVHVRAVAVTGAVIGALIGLTTYAFGVRVAGAKGRRLGRVVTTGLLGAALGSMPTLLYVAAALRNLNTGESMTIQPPSLLVLYGVTAVLAYGTAVLAIWLLLRATGDGLAGRTAQCTAWLLPIGTIAATGAGAGAAWLYEFTTHAYAVSVTVTVTVVILVLSLTFASARTWALRGRSFAA